MERIAMVITTIFSMIVYCKRNVCEFKLYW